MGFGDPSAKPGVSNWHFAGRMLPVNMFYAARDKDQNKKMSKNDKVFRLF
jgi:hypothetical protein